MQSHGQFDEQQIYRKRVSLPPKTIRAPNSEKNADIIFGAFSNSNNWA